MPVSLTQPTRRLITSSPDHHGIVVGSDPRQARQVRRWVVQTARVTPRVSQRIALVASELVNNAFTHTRSGRPEGRTLVELWTHHAMIELAVTDDGISSDHPLDYPRVVPYRVEAGCGGGLRVVQAEVSWWDWALNPDGGITVRCAITRTGWRR